MALLDPPDDNPVLATVVFGSYLCNAILSITGIIKNIDLPAGFFVPTAAVLLIGVVYSTFATSRAHLYGNLIYAVLLLSGYLVVLSFSSGRGTLDEFLPVEYFALIGMPIIAYLIYRVGRSLRFLYRMQTENTT